MSCVFVLSPSLGPAFLCSGFILQQACSMWEYDSCLKHWPPVLTTQETNILPRYPYNICKPFRLAELETRTCKGHPPSPEISEAVWCQQGRGGGNPWRKKMLSTWHEFVVSFPSYSNSGRKQAHLMINQFQGLHRQKWHPGHNNLTSLDSGKTFGLLV